MKELAVPEEFIDPGAGSWGPPPGTPEFIRLQCYVLSLVGQDVPAIASAVGVSQSAVVENIEAAIAERAVIQPAVQTPITLGRLDQYIRALQPAIAKGDPTSIKTALMVESERAKILGLYAPTKVDATVTQVSAEDVELAEMIREAEAANAVAEARLAATDATGTDDPDGPPSW